jgi:hypothetical protein
MTAPAEATLSGRVALVCGCPRQRSERRGQRFQRLRHFIALGA